MWKFKVATLALIATFVFGVVSPVNAALTESQIQSILSLLSSFGAEQSVINNVNSSLRGQTPTDSGNSSSSSNSSNASNGCQYIGQLNRTLSEGSSGSDVSALQHFLQAQGFFTHPTITTYFGPATESAVQRWQAQHGVVSSGLPETTGYGVVGSLTRAAITRACGGSSSTSQTTDTSSATTPTCTFTVDGTIRKDNVGFGNYDYAADSCKYVCEVVRSEKWGNDASGVCVYTNPRGGQVVMSIPAAGTPVLQLVSPIYNASYALGNSIPISWNYKSVPADTQIELKLALLERASGSNVSGVSGGTWQSNEISGSGSGTYYWTTGTSRLEIPGTYELTARIRECDPRGCTYAYPSGKTIASSASTRIVMTDSTTSTPPATPTITLGVTPQDHDTFVAQINVGEWTDYTYEIDWGEGDTSAQTQRSRVVTVCNSTWTCSSPAGVSHTYGSPGLYTINVYAIKGGSRLHVATASARSGSAPVVDIPNPTIQVISPNGGQTKTLNDSLTVSWSANNVPSYACHLITFQRIDGDRRQVHYQTQLESSARSITIPLSELKSYSLPLIAGTYEVRVSVSCVKDGNGAADSSDGYITITSDSSDFPDGAIAVGVYEGSYPSGVTHSGGYHPEGTVTVNISGESSGPNRHLILTSYEPVHWVINNPNNVPIEKIIATGYYNQRVTGAPAGTQIQYLSYQSGTSYYYAYQTSGSSYNKLSEWLSSMYSNSAGNKNWLFQSGGYSGSSIDVYIGYKG